MFSLHPSHHGHTLFDPQPAPGWLRKETDGHQWAVFLLSSASSAVGAQWPHSGV